MVYSQLNGLVALQVADATHMLSMKHHLYEHASNGEARSCTSNATRGEEAELILMSKAKLLPVCNTTGATVLPTWLCTCSPKGSPASTSSSAGLRLAKTGMVSDTVPLAAQPAFVSALSWTAVSALPSRVTSP